MKRFPLYIIISSMVCLAGCSEDHDIHPNLQFSVPSDPLAFYLIEGYHEDMDLENITVDSIKRFGNRIISYDEIISYDTTAYIFELTTTGKEHFDSLYLARYARHFPIAVISEGKFLFGVYISHGACSSFADWYSLQPYYKVNYPNNFLVFSLPPPYVNFSIEPDLRKDPRMLQILMYGDKVK